MILYEFRDNVDSKETLVKEIEYDLYAGLGKKEYASFLKDVIDESDELSTKAQILLQRIEWVFFCGKNGFGTTRKNCIQ